MNRPLIRQRHTEPASEGAGCSLEVVVLHTTTEGTLQALRTASRLAEGLAAHIRLLVLQVVPYPLDLNTPQVPIEYTRRRFRTIAGSGSIDTRVDIRFGRDRVAMLETALKPPSIVVLASERRRGPRWWPSQESKLAKRLMRSGHHVLFSNSK